MFKIPTNFGIDNEVLYGPTISRLKTRRVKYRVLDHVGDNSVLCVNLNFTESWLPLGHLDNELLVGVVNNIVYLKLLVVRISA